MIMIWLSAPAGLEQCKMLRPAYAVEYDYLPAHQCAATLETKRIGGLFFSGQLNGTTGGRRGHADVLARAQGRLMGIPAHMLAHMLARSRASSHRVEYVHRPARFMSAAWRAAPHSAQRHSWLGGQIIIEQPSNSNGQQTTIEAQTLSWLES